MNSRISTLDKIIILYRTGIKFFRGGGTQNFLKGSTWDAPCWKKWTDYPWKTYSLWEEC